MLKRFLIFGFITEIIFFILIGQWLGFGTALLLILAGSLAGIILLRTYVAKQLQQLRQQSTTNNLSTQQIQSTMLTLFGAILLIIPRFFSDLLGLLCFLPQLRQMIYRSLYKISPNTFQPSNDNPDTPVFFKRIIEGEVLRDKKTLDD